MATIVNYNGSKMTKPTKRTKRERQILQIRAMRSSFAGFLNGKNFLHGRLWFHEPKIINALLPTENQTKD
jgi:hypothetical protein